MSVARLPVQGPPLDPTSEQAKQWAVEELAKQQYHPQKSLLQRFLEWLSDNLPAGGEGVSSIWLYAVTAGLLLLIALAVALTVRGRRRRYSDAEGDSILEEVGVTAAEYRRRAAQALAASDWNSAVIESVRAVATGATERVLVDDRPGRTAYELAEAVSPRFPSLAPDLFALMRRFDQVRYGDQPATEQQAREAVALETAFREARPAAEAVPA